MFSRSALKGAGSFKFFTTDAGKVLQCIHETINAAIAAKKEAAKAAPKQSDACPIPVTEAALSRQERKPSIDSFISEPSGTPPNIRAQPRHLSVPVSCELMTQEDKTRLDHSVEDFKDGMSFQSGSSSSSSSRFQFDSQSMRSGTPSPQSVRQHWKNFFPPINQGLAGIADGDKSNRTTSVSSTGSRDSGVVLDLNSDAVLRTNVWVEESNRQSTDKLSDITENDSRRNSRSDSTHQPGNKDSNESDITRSQSFNHIKQHEESTPTDQRRFTCGSNSSLPRNKRTKKMSDIYIDLDSILAAKAELDMKLGKNIDETKIEEMKPPPLPPFPPLLKPLARKSVKMVSGDAVAEDISMQKDQLQVPERKLSRSRKTSRSRKLSSTSNIYFEVGSLSDISKACADEPLSEEKTAQASSDSETKEKRDRKVSNLYLDLDTVALLRSDSFQSTPCKINSLTPPEPPPREPSPRQRQKTQHLGLHQEVERYRKNLAHFLGSPSYPTRDIPPELPQRPTNLRQPKKTSEQTGTVFSSIFGTLTRRKKRLNSADSQTNLNANKPSVRKVQSVPEWPLPVADSKVADNELYSPSMDEEFDVIDSSAENVFDANEEPPPPFPPLMDPIDKSWYVNDDSKSNENIETSARSPESRNSCCIAEEDETVEESFYMSMSGGDPIPGPSESFEADTGSLTVANTSCDSLIQSENPYLLMSNPEGAENDSLQESELYMNMGQLGGASEA